MMKQILASLDRLACNFLARYFLLLNVPESFQKVATNCKNTVVITQSSSIIVRALLRSFAQRREIFSSIRLKDYFQDKDKFTTDNYSLYWEALEEEESLEKIRTELPNFSISTFHIFAGRSPIYTSPKYKTKKATLFKVIFAPMLGLLGRQIFIFSFGDPFPVVSEKFSSKTKLSRRIKVDIFQNTKLTRGVAFQTLEDQKKYILEGQEVQRMLKLLTKKLNKSEEEIRQEMSKEFERMATQPDGFHLYMAGILSKLILKRFPEVVTIGLDNLKKAAKEGALVLIPNHRSHFDYILLNGLIYSSNFRIPLIASGMNLNFWPVGNLFCKAGAYYIRRETKPNLIHNFLLQRYITYLINRGHLQEFFIEGGRSRSGRMLPPKLGLLGIMVNAFLKKVRREVIFMPVSINYEHVAEVGEYARENSGLPKKSENCFELLKAARHFLFRSKANNGEVIIQFGEPISLANLSETLAKEETHGEAFKKKLVSGLGNIVIDRITEQSAPCLSNLAYTALMMAPYYGLTQKELTDNILTLTDYCSILKNLNSNLGDFSPALTRFINDPDHDLSKLTFDDYLTYNNELFYIPGNQRYSADFYKNSTIHIFYTLGLISILALQDQNITTDNIEHLYNLLGQRNLVLRQNDIKAEADLIIKALQKRNILSTPTSNTEKVAFINKDSGYYVPALLLNNLESLAWIYKSYIKQKNEEKNAEYIEDGLNSHGSICTFNTADIIKQTQKDMLATKYIGPHLRTESSAKSSLNQAIEASKEIGIISTDSFSQGKTISLLKEPTQELAELEVIIKAIRNYLQEKGQ